MARNVTDPNKVPTTDEGSEEPAVPNGAQVELADNVGVVVLRGHPTRQIPTYNAKGKQVGWETVLDKNTQFAQPKADLGKTAHHANLKGESKKVLVMSETGVLLARFADQDTAEKHLKACGISLDKLLEQTKKLRGREIRPAVPVGK